jgi:hypothetical protein
MRTVDSPVWGSMMEQVIAKSPIEKVWPPTMPAKRLAIWEEAWLAWPHNAKDLIAHIE